MFAQNEWMKFPWTHGPEIEYLRLKIWCKNRPGFNPKFENFKLLIENLPNLKAICIVDESDPSYKNANLKKMFPNYNSYLQAHEIQELNIFEFESKIEKYSKNLPFVFHFSSHRDRNQY